ncbi:RNA polymerase-associated protein RapA [Methylovulum psychrotolerans]|uniref:RNA polymerase-associated protein RapA n=1 Tax=Methylovulum psychrotolerans TaxID=1704499 RepID=A0A1Z4BYM5_9GAMM|nr:RNA polymerase-associated protein RapA [Methylovulum psychrotolerans]ASF46407.1 RNA polymerase-binding ATPase [Methylovulum psychrotolerans]POZ53801.1 RNA polymerase-associated protein RapA [Methylovulum psychrotolerans]
MESFIPGQRWISNTESELGLGLILDVSFNRVTVLYLASDERRIYARDNAPLTRVVFSVGDTIESVDEDKLTVTEVIENNGLMTYIGKTADGEAMQFEEVELNHRIQFNKPQDRLFIGQIDPNDWFSLRYETWQRLRQHQQSPVKGLLGSRASLIPHQVFIAHESANRIAPRIMLADEVGLGKTIEAGLILHHRLINGLSQRVLIIVPESLLHQWLVEMLRRFNLRFSLFDEARCLGELGDDGMDEDDADKAVLSGNPFVNEQLVLCSQQFFAQHPLRQQQALQAGWDMVIVDEAHHLAWSEQAASSEYLFVEQLALATPSLILLTATPEQLGKESHFARLRLLDPDRFYSFAAFLAEEKQFEPVADAAKILLADKPLAEADSALLAGLLKDDNVGTLLKNLADSEKSAAARAALIKILLDHHGTGRILFRNSRQTVQGFPERERHGYPLEGDENTADLQKDPRYLWLVNTLISATSALRDQKALLICKHAQTAVDLELTLRVRGGIASAVFHEGMSIIERDRAAAYFADQDSAARLLICSEIGSEGRNFQFVHHLILWDLPTNPDLLQQRIGRLDRIGQQHVIQIHIPYLEHSRQALLYRWYDEGMNAFRANCSAARPVADVLADELEAMLFQDEAQIEAFIAKTQALGREIAEQLHNGRDQLLELNSFRKDEAELWVEQLKRYEKEALLWPYMEAVFECYGVDTEFHSPDCFIVRPSDHLRIAHFPGLDEDGVTVTVKRACALAREDMQFLTWEHPMVTAAMDLVLSSETGNAVVSVVKHRDLRPGQFLLECLFIVECSAPAQLQIGRFLPPTPIRILIDQHQQDLTEVFSHQQLPETGKAFDKQQIAAFLNSQRKPLSKLLYNAEELARVRMQALTAEANTTMLESLSAEVKRMARLKKVNPSIKAEEIEQLKDLTMLAHESIQAAQLRLDAVRFVIAS